MYLRINKKATSILKYICIFIVTVIILFSSLVITSMIPKNAIKEKMVESVEFFKKNSGIEAVQSRREYSYLHLYADSVLLNIIYSIDSNKPIESSLWCNFYQKLYADINNDFIEVVENDIVPNQQYLRYWHGSMIILRPLFTIFNIEHIYILNAIVMSLLLIWLIIILWKKSKKLAIIFGVSTVMVAMAFVPFCLEYTWTFFIMLITSIIAINIEKNNEKKLGILFLISGIFTCFFDFLTTEIITILVPIVLILIIRKKEERLNNFKEGIIFLIKYCMLWAFGYVGMWIAKWCISSIILNINAIDYVKEEAMLRVNGLQGLESKSKMYFEAIFKNFQTLYPINIIKRESDLLKIIIACLIIILALIDWKNIKKMWFPALLLVIAIIPYCRYLILANHSFRHCFFTFRSQMISIIAIIWAISECLNYDLIFKEIKLKKK